MIFQHELLHCLNTHGTRPAIQYNGNTMTYDGLLEKANAVTSYLLDLEVGAETLVGVIAPNRVDMICAMIGVFNARCVFIPIDDRLPLARQTEMIKDLNVQNILRQSDLDKIFNAGCGRPSPQYPAFGADDSLYIFFTSGTTGKPKGIVGRNSSLLHFLKWEIETFSLTGETRCSQLIHPYFDAFLRDVFVPIFCGGTICIPPAGQEFYLPGDIIRWIDDNAITLIHCVPSVFRLINQPFLTDQHFRNLHYVLLSGEKINPAELANWYSVFDTSVQLVNLYGPTETTMVRSWYLIQPEDISKTRIPAGLPINDSRLLVLQENGKPCSTIMPGHLYIASDFAAKGYLNAPELTAQKFITIKDSAGEYLAYKTGDLARILPDGNLDLLGREDQQVKIRGIRIEPAEIEQVILRAGFVEQAVVVKKTDEQGNDTLAAFVQLLPGALSGGAGHNALLNYLNDHLPAYMIPASITAVTAFPVLANGKLNYKALIDMQDLTETIPPANETEERILRIWKDILGDRPISTDAVFYSVGGNSLNMMRLIGRLYKEFHVRISLGELFGNLTIQKQGALIMRSVKDHFFTIPKAPEKPCYVLSAAQERIYFSHSLAPSGTAFNLPVSWEIGDGVDTQKIKQVLQLLTDRHESLRTSFVFDEGKIVQVIQPTVPFEMAEINAGNSALQQAINDFVQPFDLTAAPLFRAAIIITENKRVFLIDMHHIICDGMSQFRLFDDFIRLYKGQTLQPLAIQYKDYAEWERIFRNTDRYLADREFWLKNFEGGITPMQLPLINQNKDLLNAQGRSISFEMDRAVISNLLLLPNKEEVTPFTALLTAFFVFLSRITGQDDLVAGINTTGRMQHELEGVTGMFAKTLPVRCKVDYNLSFSEQAQLVHTFLTRAKSHQLYDLADMVNELSRNRTAPGPGLIQVMFVYLDFEDDQANTDTGFSGIPSGNIAAKYPITLFAYENGDTLQFKWEYATALFTEADVKLLIEQFTGLIEKIATCPNEQLITCIAGKTPEYQDTTDNIEFNF